MSEFLLKVSMVRSIILDAGVILMYYRLTSDDENFRNYIMIGYSQEYANKFDGRSLKDTYQIVTFKMTVETESKYPIADFQSGYMPICSEKTKKALEEICEKEEVEFLPCYLEGSNEDYYILNILGLEDCVDYQKSKFTTFPSNASKIMFFEHIQFREEIKRNIFRIKDLPYCHYFINEKTKQKLETSGLAGLLMNNQLFK